MISKPKDEKFTPLKYLESVREVLGEIELDPFSSDRANERVKAIAYFTKENNAFLHDWYGKIFCNSPYSHGFKKSVTEYLLHEIFLGNTKEGIFLFPNDTDQTYFHKLLKSEDFICCLTDHRIKFVNGWTMRVEDNPENGSAFFYYGNNKQKFHEVFQKWGTVISY